MTYTDPNQIGEVTEVTGAAKIIRTDGTEEPITLGTPLYQGDIVETEGDSAVNLGFLDESSFAVSNDARIALDEFVYDPASESGGQDFSVVRGMFMYTSGLIGRENPDSVEIETPVGSIGIRGTIIGGNIVEGGESEIAVIEGAIVVQNNGGERLLTNQFDSVKVVSRDSAPSEVQTLDVQTIANKFGAIKGVSASLFSSFEDQIQQQQQQQQDQSGAEGNADQQATEASDSANEEQSQNAEDGVNAQGDEAAAEEANAEANGETAEDTQAEAEAAQEKAADTSGEVKGEQLAKEVVNDSQAKAQLNSVETAASKTAKPADVKQKIEAKRAAAKEEAKEEAQQQDDASNANQQNNTNTNDNQPDINVINQQAANNNGNSDGTANSDGNSANGGTSTTTTPSLVLQSGGYIEENATGGVVAELGLDTAISGVTYALTNNPGNQFSINATTGLVSFVGGQARNYEGNGPNYYTLGVQATLPGGEIVNQELQINLTNRLEIDAALDNRFSVTGDINGMVETNMLGAFVSVIKVDEADAGGLYDIAFDAMASTPTDQVYGHFSITGPHAEKLELVFDGNDLILKLKDNVQLVDGGSTVTFEVDGSAVGGAMPKTSALALGQVEMNISGDSDTIDFNVAVGNVIDVISGSEYLPAAAGETMIGDDMDNVIRLQDTDFKFISGYEGHDLIKLDGSMGSANQDIFDFTSTVSNLIGNSADLKSIEEFRFVDQMDTLKINIEDIRDLLRTSDDQDIIFASGEAPDGSVGTEGYNGIYFNNGGTYETLTANGFTYNGVVTENGEDFHEFAEENGLGHVLIEVDIMGAANGGITV